MHRRSFLIACSSGAVAFAHSLSASAQGLRGGVTPDMLTLLAARADTFRFERPRAGLAAVKAAPRRLRRWPAASLDHGSEPAQRTTIGRKDHLAHIPPHANHKGRSMP